MLDFDGDLYDQNARVRFRQRLRGQERFDSVDDLIAQMQPRRRGRCRAASPTWSLPGSSRVEIRFRIEGPHARMPDKAATISEHKLHDSDTGSPKCRSHSSPSASAT